MQVRMTHSTGFHFDQDIARLQLRPGDFLEYQRLLEFMQDGGLHFDFPKESVEPAELLCGQASVLDSFNRIIHFIDASTMQLSQSIRAEPKSLIAFGSARHGRTPRRKNSTALLTRSDSL